MSPRIRKNVRKQVRQRETGAVSGALVNLLSMMDTITTIDVTATGASETPEPAVGGRCSPQVSSSPTSTKRVEVTRQASTASNGAGRATVGEGAKQALSSGRKAAEETENQENIGRTKDTDRKTLAERLEVSSTERRNEEASATGVTRGSNQPNTTHERGKSEAINLNLMSEEQHLETH